MRRGEIWIVAGAAGYLGKPHPAVVVQDERFDETLSIVVCPFTTDPAEAPIFRLTIEPSERNGLAEQSRLMADKITAVDRRNVGKQIGQLPSEDMIRLDRALMVFLGLARAGLRPG